MTLNTTLTACCPGSYKRAKCVEEIGYLNKKKGQWEEAAQRYEETRVLFIELDSDDGVDRCEKAIRRLGS